MCILSLVQSPSFIRIHPNSLTDDFNSGSDMPRGAEGLRGAVYAGHVLCRAVNRIQEKWLPCGRVSRAQKCACLFALASAKTPISACLTNKVILYFKLC